MLLFKQGNVLLAEEPHHILVHGCNALGVMGAGIAKQIRLIYPKVFEEYEKLYNEKGLTLGSIQTITYKTNDYNKNCIAVINAITQPKTGKGLQLSYLALEESVQRVFEIADRNHISNIVSPFIGSGLAGGNQEKIKKILNDGANRFPKINWTVYLL